MTTSKANWKTLDGRVIPIKYMTTTHIGNAIFYQNKINGQAYPPLLEEWKLREDEGILRKAKRFIGRIWGNYYKGSSKYTPKKKEDFKKLNNRMAIHNKAMWDEIKDISELDDPRDFH